MIVNELFGNNTFSLSHLGNVNEFISILLQLKKNMAEQGHTQSFCRITLRLAKEFTQDYSMGFTMEVTLELTLEFTKN